MAPYPQRQAGSSRTARPARWRKANCRCRCPAPEGEIEKGLAALWEELLHLAPGSVGRQDRFFDLGGHSLLATQVAARIHHEWGMELPLRAFFEHPELAALARHLQAEAAGEGCTLTATDDCIPLADRRQPLPLSWTQQRLWFLDQLEGHNSAYHIVGALRLKGTLDTVALQAAFDALLARHETLRTRFVSDAGEGRLHIDESARFALREVNLSGLPKNQRQHEARQRLADESAAPFDLSTGPLIRGLLLKLGRNERILCLSMHHIISDGWSMGILVNEFATLYRACLAVRTDSAPEQDEASLQVALQAALPPLPLQYADYAVWQRERLSAAALQSQLDFWRGQLEGAPTLIKLPTDHPRPTQQSYAGASVPFALPAELSARLHATARHHGLTLFMLLTTGFALLLSRLSNQNDIVIGTPVANRPRQALEGLIGFFANTLALRIELQPDEPLHTLFARVKTRVLDALMHQETPFEQVVDALKPTRSLAHSPLFQVMLSLQNTPPGELELPGLRLATQDLNVQATPFDLSLTLHDTPKGITGELRYARDLFKAETLTRWLHHYETLLSNLASEQALEGQQTVAQLELLTPPNATTSSTPSTPRRGPTRTMSPSITPLPPKPPAPLTPLPSFRKAAHSPTANSTPAPTSSPTD